VNTGFLIQHNFAMLAREPGPILSRILMPLVLITAMRPLYAAALGEEGVTTAVTGMLILFSMLALSLIGTGLLSERVWHTLDRLRAAPTRPRQILLGKAIPYGVVLLGQQVAILGYGVVVLGLHVRRWDLLAVAGVAWAATLLCAGAAVATIARSYSGLAAITDIGSLFFTVLGGAMVPIALMPSWLAELAPISPGYWALGSLRSAVLGDTAGTLRDVVVLAGFSVVLGALAAWRISRGWTRSRLL
jgi:ABC-2 type transport system permease protein